MSHHPYMPRTAMTVFTILLCVVLAACGRDYSGPSTAEGVDTGSDVIAPDAGSDTTDQNNSVEPDVTQDAPPTVDDTDPVPDMGPEQLILRIAPADVEIFVGETAQFRALLIGDSEVEDVTAEADWKVEGPSAQVIAPGRVTVSEDGRYTVIVEFDGLQAEASLMAQDVAENLVDIAVIPEELEVPEGFRSQLRATGLYDNGISRDISSLVQWSSQAPDVFTVDDQGSVEGLSAGSGQVRAELEGIRGFGLVTVVGAELESIEVIPR